MSLHPFMRECLIHKWGNMDDEDLLMKAHQELAAHMMAPAFLGSGGEGFVYIDGPRICKYIINWTHPCRDINKVLRTLQSLSNSIAVSHPRHMYRIKVRLIATSCLCVEYIGRPGIPLSPTIIATEWSRGLSSQLDDTFSELMSLGFFHTNPDPSNFVLDDGVLKIIDYGGDIVRPRAAVRILARMHFTRRCKQMGIQVR